jgi:hypothetical protein
MLPPQPPRPAPPATAITLPKLLLVEGDTPMHFFEALLCHLGLDPHILILNYRGTAALATYLKTLAATPDFARLVTSVGVVRDAENDAAAAGQGVTHALSAAALTAARTPPIRTSVFILPDNNNPGMIETLCMEAVKNEPTLANSYTCVEEFFVCLGRSRVALPSLPVLAKNQAQAYLATRQDVQMFPGIAAYRDLLALDQCHLPAPHPIPASLVGRACAKSGSRSQRKWPSISFSWPSSSSYASRRAKPGLRVQRLQGGLLVLAVQPEILNTRVTPVPPVLPGVPPLRGRSWREPRWSFARWQ